MILVQVQSIFTRNLTTQTQKLVESSSLYFNSIFSQDIEVLNTIKNTINAVYNKNDYDDFVNTQDKIIRNIVKETPQFLSVGISWELSAVEKNYTKNYGRYRYLYYWRDGNIIEKSDTLNINGDDLSSLYYLFKISMQNDITDIYYDTYTGRDEDKQLMTSIGIPIILNRQFAGIVAADISLDRFSEIIKKIKPIPEAQTFMISHNGNIVANSDDNYINEPFTKVLKNDVSQKNLLLSIKNGESVSYIQKDSLGNENFIILQPFSFGNISRTWSIGTIIPLKVIRKDANKLIRIAVTLAIIGLILMIFITLIILNSIIKPINYAVDSLEKIANFDISEEYKLDKESSDELGRMATSLNKLIDSLTEIKSFTHEIAEGNLDLKYESKSERDVLGKALIEMQRSLKIAKIEGEKRDADEKIQNWIVNGESKIAEILRNYSQDFEQLSYEVVSYLVKYTGAAQGALFTINEEAKLIELRAAYAYEKRKFLQKSIPFGIGLIGRSVQEGELVYITDIPEGYSSISSGLGEKEPRSLLIVPFKFNDVIYAVFELNSFGEFKPHVRRFIEKIGVSIASTIANLLITSKTNKLVNELKENSEVLRQEKEQLSQEIEEYQTANEELIRRTNEQESIVNALNKVSYIVVYNMNRQIIDINPKFLNFLNKTRHEMLGSEQGIFINNQEQRKELDNLWNKINKGQVTMFTQQALINGKNVWFSEAYIPILDGDGKPFKVINISNDISNLMNKQ